MTIPRSVTAAAMALSCCWLVVPGCGAEPPADPGSPAETVASAQESLSTCVVVQRGTFGVVRDTQVVRRLATPLATDPDANANFGALSTAMVGTSGVIPLKKQRKSLLSFDLSFVPGNATVTSATVTLDTTNTGAGQVGVRRSTAAWNEGTVTFVSWNNAQSAADYGSFQAGPGAAGPRTFDAVALVQEWVSGLQPNFGMVLLEESPTLTFSTSEAANVALRPKLSLCYTTPDACTPNPCSNGGACSLVPGGHACACPAGYSGANCETATVSCPCSGPGFADTGPITFPQAENMSCNYDAEHIFAQTYWQSPAREFGSGTSGSGQPYCFMHTMQFDGSATCDVTLITPEQEAACRQEILDWTAGNCYPFYDIFKGPTDTCEPCLPNPCQNGASCTPVGNSYTCDCPPGYSGVNCELDPTICPCDGPGFADDPPVSFGQLENMQCNYDADHVLGQAFWQTPLRDFGAGTSSTGESYCFLKQQPFVGDYTCGAVSISAAQAAVCRQEILAWGGNNCYPFYDIFKGPTDTCEPCLPNPCLNGGSCASDWAGNHSCTCPAGFSGENCEL